MRGVCLVDICVCTPRPGASARAMFALHLNIPPATNIICKLSKLDAENPDLLCKDV